MKDYETPELKMIYFETEDILTTSGERPGEIDTPDLGGDDF